MSCSTPVDSEEANNGSASTKGMPIIIANGQTYMPNVVTQLKGAKGIKDYNVENLLMANSAVRVIYSSKRYEARFYPSHELALEPGIKWANSVVGEGAMLLTREALWQEGANDRRKCTRNVAHAGCSYAPVYTNFAVIGNMVLLCEGLEERSGRESCQTILNAAGINIATN